MRKVTEKTSSLIDELDLYVRARYPILYLVTAEENRAEHIISQAAERTQKPCYYWTVTEGFYNTTRLSKSTDPYQALDIILQFDGPGIFILKDFHPYMENSKIIRKFRDILFHLRKSYKTIFIIAPILTLPPGLEMGITPIDIPLPNTEELKKILLDIIHPLEKMGKIQTQYDDDLIEKVVHASSGLTEIEAQNLYARLVINNKSFDEQDIPFVVEEKKKVIRKSGILDYYGFIEDMGAVGGLEKLKHWVTQRGLAFSHKAREFGLPEPKGLMLLGVQGCGKSLAAKATATLWNLPLLKLDVGKIFDSYIGSSEKNMREAIQVAESLAPNILWLDEIEKAFAGMGSGHTSDSGTSTRVFGTFLTWMQEKTSPVFIIATANNIQALPPELLRKGRFDEIFFIDLPNEEERAVILRIHLKKRQRDPEQFNLTQLVEQTEGFSGAELEQLIISSLYTAFGEGRDLEEADIVAEIQETVPLSVTYKEYITSLRSWAATRARPAT
ncbi:AAA family ATPase [Desulfogranum japonicum]|uniref:AAA family ATPase n=1 Tax=Desulfogranum japonicum TaxID=231447 RepID=UPI000418428D|nr:AAA family ATPase [Desulfogranum japonicum]